MKDWHNIGTWAGVLLLAIGSIFQYFGLENNHNILLFIYITAILCLFIQPIIEIALYYQNKNKE